MLKLHIDTGNAAFADGNEAAEVARILRELAQRIEDNGGGSYFTLHDVNGNRVGECTMTERDDDEES